MVDDSFVKGNEELPEVCFSLSGMPDGWMGVTAERYEMGLEDEEFPKEPRVLYKDYSDYDAQEFEDALVGIDWEDIESRFNISLDESDDGFNMLDNFTYSEDEMDEVFLACIDLIDQALEED